MRRLKYGRDLLAATLGCAMASLASAADLNDYPTSARAEYVWHCMAGIVY